MSTEALADALSSLALTQTELHTESTQDCVPFRPSEKFAWLQLSDSPRYLFRVYTRYTDGHTDASCVKSKDACKNEPNAAQDIFDREDVEEAAAMLDRHLRWKGSYKDSDNLMSWTSSLLFALRYLFFRHHHNSCPLEEIMLCVIDTTKLVANTFIRDMDLMHAFEDFCPELKDFKDGLRTKKSKFHSGHWYFGEYLSQGSLKIEGKSCTVSAKAVVDAGLFLLQPGFKVAMEIRSQRWANDVIELREPFYSSSTTSSQQQELSWEQVVAAIEIGKLFGEPWTLPMAANFFSLLPRKENDAILIAAFRDGYLLRENAAPSKTRIVAYETLPEVEQMQWIMKSIYTDYCVRKIENHMKDAEISLRGAIRFVMTHKDEINKDFALPDSSWRSSLRRVDTVEFLSQKLRSQSTE